ncbi:MAG: hypothetical protein U0229_13725 [Anaeromyxobacter sp.]
MAGLGLAAAGCATVATGTGAGTLTREGANAGQVAFAWRSEDGGQTGRLAATLADGRRFEGPFFQITRSVDRTRWDAMWAGWDYGWRGWRRGWAPLPEVDHATTYSGRVVANLAAPDGTRMRCKLQLQSPRSGLSGGGEGVCQVRGDGTVDVTL